jgi:hypothetical protein
MKKKSKEKKEKTENKKPKKISTKNLGDDQKEFIESKVKEFKTLKEVKAFYRLEDAVSTYAIQLAKKLKLPEEES